MERLGVSVFILVMEGYFEVECILVLWEWSGLVMGILSAGGF